jgi:peptidoglycan/LPS O-acetylase OafA/YrhL
MEHRRVETIDLLRLLAALAVVTYHYTYRGAAGDGIPRLNEIKNILRGGTTILPA